MSSVRKDTHLPLASRSVEPLSRVVLLFLVDHNADHDARHAPEDAEEQEEERLDPGHGRGLGVVDVVPGGLEEGAGGRDLGAVLAELRVRHVELVGLHGDDVVVVREIAWKENQM